MVAMESTGESTGVQWCPRLFLVRHGQTTSNTIHALDTALPGADLTSLGREQALAAGTELARVSDRLMVVSSFAARAQQTAVNLAVALGQGGADVVPADVPSASPLSDATAQQLAENARGAAGSSAPGVAVEDCLAIIPDVAEIQAGDMEMRNDEDAHAMYLSTLSQWLHGDLDLRVPGGGSGAEVLEAYVPRVVELIDAARRNQCDVALVSHGAVIRLVAAFLGGVDPDWAFAAYLRNAQVVTLEPGDLADSAAASGSASASTSGSAPVSASASASASAFASASTSGSAHAPGSAQAGSILATVRNSMHVTSWGGHPLP